MANVLVAGLIHPAGLAILEARPDIDFTMLEKPTAEAIADRAPALDGLLIRVTPFRSAAIDSAKSLKIVSRFGVGYDNIDVPALTVRGIPLTVIGDANAVPVAEHALMFMLAAPRELFAQDRCVRDGNYADRDRPGRTELFGKTVLIVGYGRIGRQVAKRCAAFDTTIIVADPYVDRAAVEADGYRHVADFRDALGEADVVTLHIPGNADGTPVIDAATLAAMKPGVVFVNCARGTLVDEAALAEALASGQVKCAGLDVTRQEPPPADLALLRRDDVIFTPHSAALTDECRQRMSEVAAQNILDGLDGKLKPELVVNREVLG
jgi:D-3-phosphoglycerate dehydrogenase